MTNSCLLGPQSSWRGRSFKLKSFNRVVLSSPIRQAYGKANGSGFSGQCAIRIGFLEVHESDHRLAFPAVVIGSCALAFGPWLVRLAGVGPVAAGVWRLALALPFLFVIAAVTRQPVHWPKRKLAVLVAIAAFFF